MWQVIESDVCPNIEDTTSSRIYNYVRRNVKEVEREEKTVFVYEEMKVPKEAWELYLENKSLQEQLTEQADAICELAEIIAEV